MSHSYLGKLLSRKQLIINDVIVLESCYELPNVGVKVFWKGNGVNYSTDSESLESARSSLKQFAGIPQDKEIETIGG